MRIDSRKPKAAALSATLAVALLVGAGVTDAHAATLSDAVGSTPSEATLMQPVDYRGDGFGSMQEWNASMGAKRDSLEVRAQIIMNMYGDYATDDERAVLQGCIDGAGSLLTMEEVDAKSAELDELRSTLEDAKREALEAAAVEAEAAEAVQASYYNAGSGSSYASAAYYANGSGLTRSSGVNNYNGRPLRALRASARSTIRVAQPELPITTPVGNLSASIAHDGRASLPSFRAM